MTDLDKFLLGYTDCALWSSMDSYDEGGVPLDTLDCDIAPETLAEMRKDCADFMQANAADLIDIPPEHAGHDFWLTRHGHGTGYWDRGLGEVGKRLTEACKPYGSVNLWVGEDGLIHS